MSLKEIIQLKDKKIVYVLEENDSTYIYRKDRVTAHTLTNVLLLPIVAKKHLFNAFLDFGTETQLSNTIFK